jgi:hypothetical protein
MGAKGKLPPDPGELGLDPTNKELIKLRYQAWLDLNQEKTRAGLAQREAQRAETAAADRETEKAAWANEYALAQAIHNAYVEVAKGEIDRMTARAEFVQKVSAAISGIYIAALGLTFGIGEHSTPLPAQGFAATIFLGLAIFLATAYAVFVTEPEPVEGPTGGDLYTYQNERLQKFILWARATSLNRRQLLNASILSLGIGVVCLPLAYLNLRLEAVEAMVLAGLVITAIPFIGLLFERRQESQPAEQPAPPSSPALPTK